VKRVRSLAQRKHRQREAATVVHGIQPVRQAVEAGFAIECLIVAPSLLSSESTREFVDAQSANVRVITVTGDVFRRLSDRDGPAGLAAIVGTRYSSPDHLVPDAGPVTVIALDRIGNPGNLGTIVRTADATGAAAVLLVGNTADPFDPVAIKASMGAVFNVPVARLPDLPDFFGWARERDLAVAATSARGQDPLWRTHYPDRLALLLGSEGDGLDETSVHNADVSVAIPMVGTAESLNVAVAAGVLMYDVWRLRRPDH